MGFPGRERKRMRNIGRHSQTQRKQDGKYRVKVTKPLHEYRLIDRG